MDELNNKILKIKVVEIDGKEYLIGVDLSKCDDIYVINNYFDKEEV